MKSIPADIVFAAMFTPSCAIVKAVAMKKTPARSAEFAGWPVSLSPSRNRDKTCRGFQTALLLGKMTVEAEPTIMPTKDVKPKLKGMAINCGHLAELVLFANRVRSELLIMTVDMLARVAMMADTMAHARSEPCTVAGWLKTGPTLAALATTQMRRPMPPAGATIALTVNK